ncbi:hypothetical protein ACFHW0_31395 [Micromonospora sp. LOL_025]|uniref:hypothetical protein n=1 Tax=Micromonospora sp. LOL_025 TaxID=3345413 RepID=UPI003A86565C
MRKMLRAPTRTWTRLAAVTVAMAMAMALTPMTPANATPTLVACSPGTETTTFDPPLTLITQQTDVHVDGTLGPCVSTTNPNINGATFTIDGEGPASCLLANFNSTYVANWNDGPDSVITYYTNVNLKPAGVTVFVSYGEVVSGQFQGAQVVRTTVEATIDVLKCATTGVPASSGPTTLTLIAP